MAEVTASILSIKRNFTKIAIQYVSLILHPDLFCDANRSDILRMDDSHNALEPILSVTMLYDCLCRFCRKSFAPILSIQQISDLDLFYSFNLFTHQPTSPN